jgi:hypothetical protein
MHQFRQATFIRSLGEKLVCRLFLLVYCVAYFSTLKMEAIYSSETSDPLRITSTCRYNAKESTSQNTYSSELINRV